VRLLEASLGFDLFVRTGRGIDLTERGRSFLYEAERVVGEVLGLADTAGRLRGVATETFSVGMGSGMSELIVPDGIAPFAQRFPNVRLDIVITPTRRIYDELHAERLDMGIAIEVDPDKLPAGLQRARIAEIEMVLVVRPDHRLAGAAEPVDLARLLPEPMIFNELNVGYGEVTLAMFTDLGVRPNIRAVCDNVETVKVMIAAGMGIAILPRSAVPHDGARSGLRVLATAPRRSVVLSAVRRRQGMSRARESYYAALRECLGGIAAAG
jgi:DNA-binding transcriptional LysR family regulator